MWSWCRTPSRVITFWICLFVCVCVLFYLFVVVLMMLFLGGCFLLLLLFVCFLVLLLLFYFVRFWFYFVFRGWCLFVLLLFVCFWFDFCSGKISRGHFHDEFQRALVLPQASHDTWRCSVPLVPLIVTNKTQITNSIQTKLNETLQHVLVGGGVVVVMWCSLVVLLLSWVLFVVVVVAAAAAVCLFVSCLLSFSVWGGGGGGGGGAGAPFSVFWTKHVLRRLVLLNCWYMSLACSCWGLCT